MDHAEIISSTIEFVKKHFQDEGSGHDWWHIYRVRKLALTLAETVGGDLFIIEMASLLHDLDDWKLKGNGSLSLAEEWLGQINVNKNDCGRILEIIYQVSFRGANVETPATTVEAKIVQDADRLDAIGAVGIARAFSYGGSRNRLIFDPDSKPVMHESFDDYKKSNTATINHFYEKLLLLKDRMQTVKGRELAEMRHIFMLKFLDQFFSEWEGKI
jgi:uncharacterized protein